MKDTNRRWWIKSAIQGGSGELGTRAGGQGEMCWSEEDEEEEGIGDEESSTAAVESVVPWSINHRLLLRSTMVIRRHICIHRSRRCMTERDGGQRRVHGGVWSVGVIRGDLWRTAWISGTRSRLTGDEDPSERLHLVNDAQQSITLRDVHLQPAKHRRALQQIHDPHHAFASHTVGGVVVVSRLEIREDVRASVCWDLRLSDRAREDGVDGGEYIRHCDVRRGICP
jgi:hypothetical protein